MRLILDSGPDGGACPPVGPCRGFEGNCGDIANQFATLPVLPDFPNGLADWQCTAFPDDENKPVDSFIVGLISIAIGLPVSLFIATCFAIANDSEAPESWLEWFGYQKLIWGPRAHRRWHYTGPAGPPRRYVKWYLRSVGAPQSETAANLVRSLWAFLTCTEPAWVEEAREAEEEAYAAVAEGDGGAPAEGPKSRAYRLMAEHNIPAGSGAGETSNAPATRANQLFGVAGEEAHEEPTSNVGKRVVTLPAYDNGRHDAPSGYGDATLDVDVPDGDNASVHSGSTSSSIRSAKALSRYKRLVMGVGVGGTLLTWAIFAWFIFTCACALRARVRACAAADCVCNRRWHALLQAAGRRVAGQLRQGLGHQLCVLAARCVLLSCCVLTLWFPCRWPERGDRVARHRAGGCEGHGCSGDHGVAHAHAPLKLARGASQTDYAASRARG